MDNNTFIEPIIHQGQTAPQSSRPSSGIDAHNTPLTNASQGIVQGISRLPVGTIDGSPLPNPRLIEQRLGVPLYATGGTHVTIAGSGFVAPVSTNVFTGRYRLSHYPQMETANANQNTYASNTWKDSNTSGITSHPFTEDLIPSESQPGPSHQWRRPSPPYNPGARFQSSNPTRLPQRHTTFESYRARPYYSISEARGEVQGRENRFKRWLITRNGPDQELFSLSDSLRTVAQSPVVKYIVVATEPNSAGKLHLHCYLHLKDRFSTGNLQAMWPFLQGANFRSIGDANSWEAEEYVKKRGNGGRRGNHTGRQQMLHRGNPEGQNNSP